MDPSGAASASVRLAVLRNHTMRLAAVHWERRKTNPCTLAVAAISESQFETRRPSLS